MKKLILSLLIFCLVGYASHLQAAGIESHSFYSEMLGRVATYAVYTPEKEKETERFPVLYILHGAWGSWHDWPDNTNVAELAKRYRMILVFPDGGQFGWYVDSSTEKLSRYDSFVSGELVAHIDAHYPTIPIRDARGIMGLSMGGHGALSLAAKYPGTYGSASSLSGILNLTNHPTSWQIPDRLGPLVDNREAWEANSVFHLADRFKTSKVQIMFDCGASDDKTLAIGDNRELDKRLTDLKIPHIYREFAGTHSWQYWKDHLQEHLNFHQAAMIGAIPDPDKWFALYYKRIEGFLTENATLAIEPPTSPTLCLLGSSSMQGMPSDLYPGYRVFNRGISADRLGIGARGISQRMEESVFDMKPDIVFLKCARNDLAARAAGKTGKPTDDELAALTESILTQIHERLPNTLILLGDAFPVRDNYAHLAPSIAVFVPRQKEVAQKLGIPLIDGHGALIGADGLLRPENSADGLHLSPAGKAIVAGMILEEIKNNRPALAPSAP